MSDAALVELGMSREGAEALRGMMASAGSAPGLSSEPQVRSTLAGFERELDGLAGEGGRFVRADRGLPGLVLVEFALPEGLGSLESRLTGFVRRIRGVLRPRAVHQPVRTKMVRVRSGPGPAESRAQRARVRGSGR